MNIRWVPSEFSSRANQRTFMPNAVIMAAYREIWNRGKIMCWRAGRQIIWIFIEGSVYSRLINFWIYLVAAVELG